MDTMTADMLRKLNNRFYQDNRMSFSATRRNSWPGWERCLGACTREDDTRELRVLDVACGTMRLAEYLQRQLAYPVAYTGVDSTELFEELPQGARFAQVDLLAPGGLSALSAMPQEFDLCCCFGFMHHVPGCSTRFKLLEAMLQTLRPGGVLAVSFWRFASDTQLAQKARETTSEAVCELGIAGLEEGDYLLGWQNEPGAWRYCHNFSDDELESLRNCVLEGADSVDSFYSDGRNGQMNAYLVWRKH